MATENRQLKEEDDDNNDQMDRMSKRERRRMGLKDKISSLPQKILGRVLSFLPLKEAIRTSILSKKWKNMWKLRYMNWTNPPPFLLERVLHFLEPKTATPCLRGVCRFWRSSAPIFNSSAPYTQYKFMIPNINSMMYSFTIVRDFICILSRRHSRKLKGPRPVRLKEPWLVRLKESSIPKRWKLLNLAKNGHEPLFTTKPTNVTAGINLTDTNFELLTSIWTVCDNAGAILSKKVVGGWMMEKEYRFAVLIQLNEPQNGLLLVRMDRRGVHYTDRIFEDSKCNIKDIHFHGGCFYVFEQVSWRIGMIDPNLSPMQLLYKAGPAIAKENYFTVSLITVDVTLVLVVENSITREDFPNTRFRFFVPKRERWEEVPSLGDYILFLGSFVSFSLAAEKVGWKPSVLLLMNNEDPNPAGLSTYTHFIGNGFEVNFANYPVILSIYKPGKKHKGLRRVVDLMNPKYTELFFPPPHWVRWVTSDTGDEKKLHRLRFSLTGVHSANFLFGLD